MGCIDKRECFVVLRCPHEVFGGSHLQHEFLRSQFTGIADFLHGLIEIPEAVVNLRQPRDVFRRSLRAFCNRCPRLQCVVGLLLNVIELTEVLTILRIRRSQLHGFFIQRLCLVNKIRLAKQVGNLRDSDRIVRAIGHDLIPDAKGCLPSHFQILRLILQDQLAPVSQKIRVRRCSGNKLFILFDRFGNSLIVNQLIDERLSQIGSRWSQFQRLFHPLCRLRHSRRLGQKPREASHSFHIFRMRSEPRLIVLDETVLIARSKEHIVNATANVFVDPTVRIQLRHDFFQISDAVFLLSTLDFQFGNFDQTHRAAVVVLDEFRQPLITRQCFDGIALLSQRDGNLFEHSRIIREERFQSLPHLHRIFGSLSPLVNATQLLKNLQQVVSLRLAFNRALERRDRLFILPDSQQRLSKIV